MKLNASQFDFDPNTNHITIAGTFMFSTQVNINITKSGEISFGFDLHLLGIESMIDQPVAYINNPIFIPGEAYSGKILFVSDAYYFTEDDVTISPAPIRDDDYTFDRQTGLITFSAEYTQMVETQRKNSIIIEIKCGADILTCEATGEDSAMALNTFGKCDPNLYMSRDGLNWEQLEPNKYITISNQSKVYIYGDNSGGWSQNEANYATITCVGQMSVKGDLSSLIIDVSADRVQKRSIPCDYCFYKAFCNSYGLVSAPDILFDIFPDHSCESLFENCGQLSTTPDFSENNITLHKYAFKKMFYNCIRLTDVNSLKCSVDEFSCDHMFTNCTQLASTGEFNKDGVAYQGSFSHMFDGCVNLKDTHFNVHS